MTITPSDGPNKGKAIQCLYTQEIGPATKRMTLAMGLPGSGSPPESYDLAMTAEGGLAELYLSKCKDGEESAAFDEPSQCDFSSSLPH